jgi:hypothetical protein
MATLMERLKQLGIGVKSDIQKQREATPGMNWVGTRGGPSYADIKEQQRLNREAGVTYPIYQGSLKSGEKLRNINGITYVIPAPSPLNVPEREMRSRFPVTGTQAQASLEPPRPRFPIPGTQALAPIGLFTQRDPNPTVLPPIVSDVTPVPEQDMTNVPEAPDQEAIEEQELIEMGDQATKAMEREMFEQRDKDRAAAFGDIKDSILNSLIEANNSTAIYDSLVSGAKRFDRGFQNVFDDIVDNVVNFDPAEEARRKLEQAIAQREQYQDNLVKEQQQQLNNKILENSRQLTNNLIQEQIDKSKAQRASQDLMDLENQVQAANNQMDRTNYVLRESGLFGQGMGNPSYSNPMQPVMPGQQPFDPGLSINSMYENPEYYQAGVALSNASADPNSPLYDPQYANRPISYYNEPEYRREVKRLYE